MTIALRDHFNWLGDVLDVVQYGDYKVVSVYHNKISNRKSNSIGYHVILPGGKPFDEYFPSTSFALLAIACLIEGKSTEAIYYMAKVASLGGSDV